MRFFLICGMILSIHTSQCKTNPAGRKNVLVLVSDDGGFEIGTYRKKVVQTPNLNALSKNSLIFNNLYASVSSCSPSRSAILTGRPIHSNGMYGLHHGVHHFNSFDNIHSIPNILRQSGIRTGIVGKKHVGPAEVYKFDYEQTEENNSVLQVGRNITLIKEYVKEFLSQNISVPFFLYVGFHDPHRCEHSRPEFGAFCEFFGNGESGMGRIPDWHPITYQADQVEVPQHVQDTLPARKDIAAQYTAISRLDQGIGLVLKEVESAGFINDTLIIYTSDNGIPFPSGRTNLYDAGIRLPMFLSAAEYPQRRYQVTYAMASHLDLVPTVLDWFSVPYPSKNLATDHAKTSPLPGRSLLPLLIKEPEEDNRTIFASHSHHEVTMYYPMRAIRTKHFKLIHNLNYRSPFPIDQDFFISRTFQDLLNNTRARKPTRWNKNLRDYYFRPEWELFDLRKDAEELKNVAEKPAYKQTFEYLKQTLSDWQKSTDDPWQCAPGGVLEDKGRYKHDPTCLPLGIDQTHQEI